MSVHSLRSHRGQALVEFAIVAPLLLALVFGIVQFGIVFNHSITLTDAVRAGARAAVVAGSDQTAEYNAAWSAIESSAGALDTSLIHLTVTPDPGGTAVTVTATYPYSVDIVGIPVHSGDLSSSTTESLD